MLLCVCGQQIVQRGEILLFKDFLKVRNSHRVEGSNLYSLLSVFLEVYCDASDGERGKVVKKF